MECPECGKEMIADEHLGDGYILTCPACGAKSEYCASNQDDPAQASISQPPVQQSTPQRRPPYSDRPTYDDLKAEMKAEMERRAAERAATEREAKAANLRKAVGSVALLLFVIGAGAYCYCRFIRTGDISVGDIQETQPTPKAADVKNDAQKMVREDELRRQKIKEEEERHRLERKQKQEQLEKERAEQRAKLAEEKAKAKELEKAYRDAQNAFAGKASYFAFSAPDGAAVDPRQMKEAGKLWAIDKSFMGRGLIYEIKTGEQGIESVTVLSNRGTPKEIGEKDFTELFNQRMWAVSNGECTWLWGTGNGSRQIPIPTGNGQLYPIEDELSDVFEAINSLQIKLPNVKYRLTLKPKRGGKSFTLGIFNGSESIAFEKIQNPIREKLANERGADKISKIKKPKAKKFKPTVVWHDGAYVAKNALGVTLVPRNPNSYPRNWSSLCEEADRQQRKAQEVEEENRAAMREYERKMEEAKNIRIPESEIDAELQKYDLLIERSKTKYP